MESGLFLDVVVRESSSVFQLLSSEDQSLLVRGNSFFVLDLLFHSLDSIRGFDLKSDSLSSQSLNEDLHPTTKTKNQVKSGFFLDVVVRESSSVLELLSSENQSLLVRGNSFLVLDLLLYSLDCVWGFNFKSDSFSSQSFHENLHVLLFGCVGCVGCWFTRKIKTKKKEKKRWGLQIQWKVQWKTWFIQIKKKEMERKKEAFYFLAFQKNTIPVFFVGYFLWSVEEKEREREKEEKSEQKQHTKEEKQEGEEREKHSFWCLISQWGFTCICVFHFWTFFFKKKRRFFFCFFFLLFSVFCSFFVFVSFFFILSFCFVFCFSFGITKIPLKKKRETRTREKREREKDWKRGKRSLLMFVDKKKKRKKNYFFWQVTQKHPRDETFCVCVFGHQLNHMTSWLASSGVDDETRSTEEREEDKSGGRAERWVFCFFFFGGGGVFCVFCWRFFIFFTFFLCLLFFFILRDAFVVCVVRYFFLTLFFSFFFLFFSFPVSLSFFLFSFVLFFFSFLFFFLEHLFFLLLFFFSFLSFSFFFPFFFPFPFSFLFSSFFFFQNKKKSRETERKKKKAPGGEELSAQKANALFPINQRALFLFWGFSYSLDANLKIWNPERMDIWYPI